VSARTRPTTAFIGSGRLTRALLPPLVAAGWPVVAVAARRRSRGLAARGKHRDIRVTTVKAVAARLARVVLLAVPDAAIEATAQELASVEGLDWHDRTVLHHAGSLGLEPLHSLALAGAAVGVLHPLQALGSPSLAGTLLRGSRARIEGDRRARRVAAAVARDLGLVPLKLGTRMSAEHRTAYHVAASLLSNDLVALLSLGVDLLDQAGLDRAEAVRALAALARGTLEQASVDGLGGPLTGPVARGDSGTLEAHLDCLSRRSRDDAEIHRLLSLRMLELLAREGLRLPADLQRRLRRLLRARSSGPDTQGTV
jgi:predicted short-subunit dehydrogenase-like oxidoreductase (DUF2520 family)